ncbi:unnamed protein product [Orchesella dallaii]|uniref:F-box domain-containing protein n=1 Tax=Orchesella dallaii TaxID=48710 RepID=A0ABP1QQU5_9HEXA
MASLNVLPNEVLCNILDMLTTKEKFRVREVCSRWKDLVDKSVPFYGVKLSDEKYDEVATRFGTRRVSSLKFACGHRYSRHSSIIPIQNLSFLKRLVLTKSLDQTSRLDALADLVKRADKLVELEIRYGDGTNWHGEDKIAALLPALRKIKKLFLPQYRFGIRTLPVNSWKSIIHREMPELQHLQIDVVPWNRNLTHFNFFELATFKPHLREIVIQNARDFGGFPFCKRVTVVWDVKSCNAKGLRKLKLLGEASRVLNEAPQWKTLLSNQNNMEELQLYDADVSLPGPRFNISMIQPVLRKSMETLHTIRLDIRAERPGTRGDFDMEIFAHLATLRVLHLSAWEVKQEAVFANKKNVLRGVKNCSTVISATLCKLVLHGFTFSTEEANNCIQEISKLDLEKVELLRSSIPEISTVWKWFSRRALKMGLKKDVQAKTLYLPAKFAGVEFHFKHRKSSTC